MKYIQKPEGNKIYSMLKDVKKYLLNISVHKMAMAMPQIKQKVTLGVGSCNFVIRAPSLLTSLLLSTSVRMLRSKILRLKRNVMIKNIGDNLREVIKVHPVDKVHQNIIFQKRSLVNHEELYKFIAFKFWSFVESSIQDKLYKFVLFSWEIITQTAHLFKEKARIIGVYIVLFSVHNTFASEQIELSQHDIISLITNVEEKCQIPSGLLRSIVKSESNFNPYAINIHGKSVLAKNRQNAKEIIEHHLKQGSKSIDIGIAQINYKWHGDKFQNLDALIDPTQNIEYAAKLLVNLKDKHGDWHKAVRYYHSSNSVHHKKYSRQVMIGWLST